MLLESDGHQVIRTGTNLNLRKQFNEIDPVSAYFGSMLLPAGHYSISQIHYSNSQPILENESIKGVHFFLNANRMESNKESDKTEVTLHQKDGSYYASKLELPRQQRLL